uniref:Uncharacterized protein n=1 Tax=Lactuca sativa TaxID=4236 RepID=A0A9R1X3J4_LACSA|nr:hypothetical protein LSAT_V11C700355440 [Lactuca sativa]
MEVCLHLPSAIYIFLSSMALGSTPSRRICRGRWITRLALYYEVDISGMVHMPIREMGTTAHGKIQWRISEDDIVELIQQVEPEDIPDSVIVRRQWPRYTEPGQPEPTLHDVMQCLDLGIDHPPFPMAGPTIPHPSQPRGTFHDGVGTSSIHPRDTDDDNDEGT